MAPRKYQPLLRGRRYRGRVVIHDQPAPVAIPVDKTESRRTIDELVVADLRKSVRPAVDGYVPIDANPLLAKYSLVRRRNGAEYVEVVTDGGGVVTKRGRSGAP